MSTNKITDSSTPGLRLAWGGDPDGLIVAAMLAAQGVPMLPCWHRSKRPAHPREEPGAGPPRANHGRWWLRTPHEVITTHEGTVDQWTGRVGCQFALITGQRDIHGNVWVLLDDDGYLPALARFAHLGGSETVEWIETTARVQHTDSDARMHLYGYIEKSMADEFAAQGVPLPTSGDLADALEWRAAGGYVMAPGSTHPEGGVYRLTAGQVVLTDPGDPPPVGGIADGLSDPDEEHPLGRFRWVLARPVPFEMLQTIRVLRDPSMPLVSQDRAGMVDRLAAEAEEIDAEATSSVSGSPGRLRGLHPWDRVAMLARTVTNAPPLQGNKHLNWAIYIAAALCLRAEMDDELSAPSQAEVREVFTEAWMARPSQMKDTPGDRRREVDEVFPRAWRDGHTERGMAALEKSEAAHHERRGNR